MKGLLKAAIRDDGPVLVFEDNSLWFQTGPVPSGEFAVPIGAADIVFGSVLEKPLCPSRERITPAVQQRL